MKVKVFSVGLKHRVCRSQCIEISLTTVSPLSSDICQKLPIWKSILDWSESCRWEVEVGWWKWSESRVRDTILNNLNIKIYQLLYNYHVFSSGYGAHGLLKVTVQCLLGTKDGDQWTVVRQTSGSVNSQLYLFEQWGWRWEGHWIMCQHQSHVR